MLAASAIDDTVIKERGCWSATAPKQLERWFAGPKQRSLVPALVVPTYDVRGELAFCQLRPDEPRVVDGRTRKYEYPHRAPIIDVPPRVQPVLGDPHAPILITEQGRKQTRIHCQDSASSSAACGTGGNQPVRRQNAAPVLRTDRAQRRQGLPRRAPTRWKNRKSTAHSSGSSTYCGDATRTSASSTCRSGDGGAKTGLDDYLHDARQDPR